jgi:hypothetical protein
MSVMPFFDKTFGDFKYQIIHGKVFITKYRGKGAEVVIPAKIDSLPDSVTAIGDEAFVGCSKMSLIARKAIRNKGYTGEF